MMRYLLVNVQKIELGKTRLNASTRPRRPCYTICKAQCDEIWEVQHARQLYMCEEAQQRYCLSAERQHHLLLLAFVLCGGAHLLAEGHVGDFETSDSGYTDPEDDDKEKADGKTHEET